LQKIIFITGTDTGVGKTVLTSLLLSHLRQAGSPVFAIKPFCSGGRADAELLYSLQNDNITLDEVNPFHFAEPLAPLAAARLHRCRIALHQCLEHFLKIRARLNNFSIHRSTISSLNNRPSTLLIEGAGGLLAPLGEPNSQFKVRSSKHYTAFDLIIALRCSVIVVAPNRLGTINHTLLTVRALQASKSREIKVVLMDINDPSALRDAHHQRGSTSRITHHSSRSNPSILAELLSPIPLFRLPHLGKTPSKTDRIRTFAKKYKKTLAKILA
jgi:dethiobiotin synthetase